ncbi:hypothetical protein O3G_MSEX014048 [Manduca sexta]|uniref:Uncharacterized protein n=1 Tax=Manduca sexta TaxID=7130 RepID=A0A922CZ19_MANSE|nr:hypothetical protein O3G_MSEX014048 [Manduca sexta]
MSCIRTHMSDMIVKDRLKNRRSACEEHCTGDPATCSCCKCIKNKHRYFGHTKKLSQNMRTKNIHKRKGFSIPSIVPNNEENDNTFSKYKHLLSSSYSALLKRAESHRHKFKRNGLNIPINIKETKKIGNNQVKTIDGGCICCLGDKRTKVCECCLPSKVLENKHYLGQSISAIKNMFPKHKEIGKDHMQKRAVQTKHKSVDEHKKVHDKICTCYHTCECGIDKEKDKLKKKKISKKQDSLSRSDRIKKMKNKRRKETQKSKSRTHDTIQRRKEYLKEQEQFRKELKKKEKAEKKNKEKLLKIERAELEAISKGREAEDTSCFVDFCLGILKLIVFIVKGVITILFKVILDPKESYTYVRLKLLDPVGTFERIMKYITDAWRIKKLQMLKSISGSDKMTILTDTLQDTAIFQAFAEKGKTPKEKRMIAQKNKQRKIRMEQRNTQAFRSCKHNLLHTLRKTPCLWVYHICPFFYPQCLGILALMKQLTEILLFMLAFIVWTPCIACCETCRAFCCCVLCTN